VGHILLAVTIVVFDLFGDALRTAFDSPEE
jgi:ABC-type dipeptide/oligopeptide/nickel transport system permease subunit